MSQARRKTRAASRLAARIIPITIPHLRFKMKEPEAPIGMRVVGNGRIVRVGEEFVQEGTRWIACGLVTRTARDRQLTTKREGPFQVTGGNQADAEAAALAHLTRIYPPANGWTGRVAVVLAPWDQLDFPEEEKG